MTIDPKTLDVLLAAKTQMEVDAVAIDQSQGWCRTLERMIEQDAMPVAWERLVALLKEHGHAV